VFQVLFFVCAEEKPSQLINNGLFVDAAHLLRESHKVLLNFSEIDVRQASGGWFFCIVRFNGVHVINTSHANH
jgi:hypothetical protein